MMQTVSKNAPGYPERLTVLSGMPETLYYIGALPDDELPSAAIVGARLCTAYGHDTAYDLGCFLASRGVQVISGMAIGIDGYAHQGALDAGGRTFAVLASGADICYPKTNADLYDRMLVSGGVLSEQPPGTKPLPYLFPSRNRIISALADIVIVVEAKRNSGSLITVDFALDQGKTVFAVPGRLGDALSDGCNYLISQGAEILCSKEQLLEELHTAAELQRAARQNPAPPTRKNSAVRAKLAILQKDPPIRTKLPVVPKDYVRTAANPPAIVEPSEDKTEMLSLSPLAKTLLSQFTENSEFTEADELTPDAASQRLSLPVQSVSAALVELQIAGYIKESARGHYRLRKITRSP